MLFIIRLIFLPSEIRIMNLCGSDKPHVCHNALQTSLIREKIERRISSIINCEIQNRVQSYKIIGKSSNQSVKQRSFVEFHMRPMCAATDESHNTNFIASSSASGNDTSLESSNGNLRQIYELLGE